MISACRRVQLTSCSKFNFRMTSSPWPVKAGLPSSMTMSSSDLSDWSSIFAEENRKRTVEVLSIDRDNSSFNSTSAERAAAVLVPLCYDIQGRPGLLCNLRSENLSSHKGEISFPGW